MPLVTPKMTVVCVGGSVTTVRRRSLTLSGTAGSLIPIACSLPMKPGTNSAGPAFVAVVSVTISRGDGAKKLRICALGALCVFVACTLYWPRCGQTARGVMASE